MPSEPRDDRASSRRAGFPETRSPRDRIVEAAIALSRGRLGRRHDADARQTPRRGNNVALPSRGRQGRSVNAVAEQVLGGVQVPEGDPDDWEGRVVGYLRDLREAALAHPALARILAQRGLTVGPVFEQLEQPQHPTRRRVLRPGRRPNVLHLAHLRVRIRRLGTPTRSPAAGRRLHSSLERRPRSARPRRLPNPPRLRSRAHHHRVDRAVRVRTGAPHPLAAPTRLTSGCFAANTAASPPASWSCRCRTSTSLSCHTPRSVECRVNCSLTRGQAAPAIRRSGRFAHERLRSGRGRAVASISTPLR